MPIPATRIIRPQQTRNFGRFGDAVEVPGLTDVQTRSYDRFLQLDVDPQKREPIGLEGVLREIFPIESYDKTINLEYLFYELGKPRYTPDECRQLRLTYGRPFRVWLRLNKEQPVQEEVYLGDMPIMIGGGEFIINGAERVVVSQLHRSPGVDYVVETEAGDRKLHSCRIIPERGSWIEINVTKKETLGVRIDQSGKFSAMTLLRAMDPQFSEDAEILKAFCKTQEVTLTPAHREVIEGAVAVGDIIDPDSGEVYVESGETITREQVDRIYACRLKSVEVMNLKDEHGKGVDQLIINSLKEDPTNTHE
jgi:DNA-directed RNA polymerase subunit beta